jgi:hypothetical protein
MKIGQFRNGMTVVDLKNMVANWPNTREDGEPCEVWIVTGANGETTQAKEVWPLNKRDDLSADILIG